MDALEKHEPAHSDQPARLAYRYQRYLLNPWFARIWLGQTLSSFGSYITSLGLPLITVLLLHGTPAQMGLLAALGAVPGLLTGPVIGEWIDRLPRRPVMIVADLGRFCLLILVPLTLWIGWFNLAWCCLIVVLSGFLTTLFEIASRAFLPGVLPPDQLTVGNSRLSISSSLAEIAGPPLASLLVQLLTAPMAMLLDALSFLFSACCLLQIRLSEPLQWLEGHERDRWYAGLHLIWKNRLLRALTAYKCTQNLCGGFFAALYLLYTFNLFGQNPLAYSIFVGMGGAGALIGSLSANILAQRLGSGRTLIGASLVFGLCAVIVPIATGPLPWLFTLLAAGQLCGDAGFAVYSINETSLIQILVPDHLQGKVHASIYILANSLLPCGALLAGPLSQAIGIRLTLGIGAGGMLLAVFWLLLSPLRRYSHE